jgi:hypothetical protein
MSSCRSGQGYGRIRNVRGPGCRPCHQFTMININAMQFGWYEN